MAVNGRTLPWLQDTAQEAVWTSKWGVTYRDVRVLDAQNRTYAVYNLTANDLALSHNREALKQLFLNAAKARDADNDQMMDEWEEYFFGDISPAPGEDSDFDGVNNFTELAFGSNPASADSVPIRWPHMKMVGQQPTLVFTFGRPAGGWINYSIESSGDLVQWGSDSSSVTLLQPVRNRFDGTGTVDVDWALGSSFAGASRGFLKVRATPRAPAP